MESLREDPLLKYPPNTLYEVRKTYGLEKPGAMAAAVNILNEWIQKQNHFVKKKFSKEYLENTIIMCKGSIEKSKKQIDKLCTIKSHLPKFFTNTNIKEQMPEIVAKLRIFLLSNLTSDFSRVLTIQLKTSDLKSEVLSQIFYSMIITAEYTRVHNYTLSYTLVFDYRFINVSDLISKLDFVEIQQIISILIEGYGTRLKALVFLTESKVIYGLVKIIKSLLKEKLGKRVLVCKDLESFHSVVPKELLPLEYGGTDKSIEDLHEQFINVISSKEHVEYMKEMQNAKTDETKRTIDVFNDQYMGMAGTFRNLHVD